MQQTETYKLKIIDADEPFSPDTLNKNTEAIADELARLDAAVAAAALGNCRIETGTYTGTGAYGNAPNSTVLQLERYPEILFVFHDCYCATFLKGRAMAFVNSYNYGAYTMMASWGADGTLSWYLGTTDPARQLNAQDTTYTYLGLYTA